MKKWITDWATSYRESKMCQGSMQITVSVLSDSFIWQVLKSPSFSGWGYWCWETWSGPLQGSQLASGRRKSGCRYLASCCFCYTAWPSLTLLFGEISFDLVQMVISGTIMRLIFNLTSQLSSVSADPGTAVWPSVLGSPYSSMQHQFLALKSGLEAACQPLAASQLYLSSSFHDYIKSQNHSC